MTSELAVRDISDLAPRFVLSLDDLRQQLAELQQFKRDIMVDGEDYGTIPGTPKPTLLKPGAEKLALAFGLTPLVTVTNKIEDWERGFFFYEVTCDLINKRSGERVANGIGSANSKEPRYRWRDAKPACPSCGHDLRRSKNDDGYYCWAKMGGCGATWPLSKVSVVGRIENPEPFELVNTLVKMAQKRALVAAVLIATGGSGIWTQDIEDMPSIAEAEPRPQPAPRKPTGPSTRKAEADEPIDEPYDPRDAALEEWRLADDEARKRGIAHKELPPEATTSTIVRWTEALVKAIDRADAESDTGSAVVAAATPVA